MTVPRILENGRWRSLTVLILLALLQAAALATAAFSTRELFSSLHASGPVSAAYLAALGGAGLVIAAVRLMFRIVAERLGQDYAKSIRLALFTHASHMWPRDLAARRVGYLSLRFVGDLSALKDWPAFGIPRLVEGAAVLPAAVAVMFVLSPVFGWIALVAVAAALACVALAGPGLAAAHRRLRVRRARMAADLTERMPIAADLAALGRRTTETELVSKRAHKLRDAAVTVAARSEMLKALPDAFMGLAAAAIIARGAAYGLSTGTIAAGLAALGLTTRPLRDIMGIANRGAAFQASHRKLAATLLRPTAPIRSLGGIRLKRGALSLELRDVTVAECGPISVAVPAGGRAHLPVCADPGALLRAVLAQEPVRGGQVLIDGTPLEDLTPGSIRRGIAMITDAPIVLRGSLRKAVTLGLPDRPADDELRATLDKGGLTPMLESLGGLDRRLQEAGRTLNRQERIRLSVLRAALARPGLILVAPGTEIPDPAARQWLLGRSATIVWADPPE